MNWGVEDVALAVALLSATGLAYGMASRKAGDGVHRAAVGVALAVALLVVWAELAVGVLGTPLSGQ